ncbi:MAG: hypothetical protein LBE09_02530, partial [Christensenellaceae bacterium]|nr:hypothetical protein [Christensenellaceae bacterium]
MNKFLTNLCIYLAIPLAFLIAFISVSYFAPDTNQSQSASAATLKEASTTYTLGSYSGKHVWYDVRMTNVVSGTYNVKNNDYFVATTSTKIQIVITEENYTYTDRTISVTASLYIRENSGNFVVVATNRIPVGIYDSNKNVAHTIMDLSGRAEGLYRIVFSDYSLPDKEAGYANPTINHYVLIDKTSPQISVTNYFSPYNSISSGIYTPYYYFTFAISDITLDKIYILSGQSSVVDATKLSSYTPTSKTTFTNSGTYHHIYTLNRSYSSNNGWVCILLVDYVGRETYFYFYVDTTNPTVSGLKSHYNASDTISFSVSDDTPYSVKIDNTSLSPASTNQFSYAANKLSDGSHSILVSNSATRTAIYSFIVDKTLPVLSSTITNGSGTNTSFSVELTETNPGRIYWLESTTAIPAVCTTSKYTNYTTSKSVTIKTSDTDGWYSFIAVDAAGNTSKVYNIFLDTGTIVANLFNYSNKELTDGAHTTMPVRFAITDPGLSSYAISFQRLNQSGSYGSTTLSWSSFLTQTIYYDTREYNIAKKIFTRNVYYTKASALAYVLSKEQSKVQALTNWSSAAEGTIYPTEVGNAVIGKDYWLYNRTNDDKLIFFSLASVTEYIDSIAPGYVGSSDNYFYEEGTFKITITDSVGNTLSKTFTIDYTPPKIE